MKKKKILRPICSVFVICALSIMTLAGCGYAESASEYDTGLQYKRYSVEEARGLFDNDFDPLFPAVITSEGRTRFNLTVYRKKPDLYKSVIKNYVAFTAFPWIYSDISQYGLNDSDISGLDTLLVDSGYRFGRSGVFPDMSMDDYENAEMPVMFIAYGDMMLGNSSFKDMFGQYISVVESDYYDPYILGKFAVETDAAIVKAKVWWTVRFRDVDKSSDAEPSIVTVCYVATGIFRTDGVNYAVTYPVYAAEEAVTYNAFGGFNKADDGISEKVISVAEKTMRNIVDKFFGA